MFVFIVDFFPIQTTNTNICPQECRIQLLPSCPNSCTTIDKILQGNIANNNSIIKNNVSNEFSSLSPSEIADVIRKTLENALDITGDPLLNQPNRKDPIDNISPLPQENIARGNPFNSTNPLHPLFDSNIMKKNPQNPLNPSGNIKNPLLPSLSNIEPPITNSLDNGKLNNNIKIPLKTTPVLTETVYQYIPSIKTITITSPPIVLHDKAETITINHTKTITQPPKTITLSPQTFVQTLPAQTVIKTINQTITALKTLIQPLQLPPETLTSYAPQQTVTEKQTLTNIYKLPPTTITVTTLVQVPATTVMVLKTINQSLPMTLHNTNNSKLITTTIVPFQPGISKITFPEQNVQLVKNPIGQIQLEPLTSGSTNINNPIIKQEDINNFCMLNPTNNICNRIENTNCTLSKIADCYMSLLQNIYKPTYTTKTNIECSPKNVKICVLTPKTFDQTALLNDYLNNLNDIASKNNSLINNNDIKKNNKSTENLNNNDKVDIFTEEDLKKELEKTKSIKPRKTSMEIGDAYKENEKTVLLSEII